MENGIDIVKYINNKIATETKLCFVSAFLIGIITHLSIITNKLTNWDDIAVTPYAGGGKFFGRWFMEYVFPVFDKWGSPSLNGIMAIFLLSISICVIVSILNIKRYTGIILTTALIMTFPSIISCMTFVYMSPTFFVAVLLAVCGVWVIVKKRKSIICFILGSALIMFSMAIYQAYFALAASLMVLAVIIDVLNGNDIKKIFYTGLYFVGSLLVSMIFYFGSIKLSGVELSSYRGMDNLGNIGFAGYMIAIARAYHRILEYFVTDQPSYIYGFLSVMMIIMTVLVVISVIYSLIYMKKRDKEHIASYIFLLFIFPLASSLVYVMAPEESNASTIMIFAYVLVLVFPIVMYENIKVDQHAINAKDKKMAFAVSLAAIVIVLASYAQYRMTNKAYYRTEVALERVSQYYNRLIMRLEMTDGYEYGDSVVILGDFYPNDLPVSAYSMEKDYWEDLEGLALEEGLFTEYIRNPYIRIHLGIEPGVYDEELLSSLKETDEYKAMPIYPEDGCIANINDIWVIRVAQ